MTAWSYSGVSSNAALLGLIAPLKGIVSDAVDTVAARAVRRRQGQLTVPSCTDQERWLRACDHGI